MPATMNREASKLSEFSSEKSEMSELAFASDALRKRIAPPGRASSVGERIRAAALDLRWTFSRTRDVLYADPRVSLKPRELRDIEGVAGVRYGREELRTVDQLIANADALLVGHEADFYRPFVAAFRAMAGAFDRARTGKRDSETTD
jgi:hypothetical protein